MANNNCKYYKEEEYQSLDGGITWTAMGVYRKGDLLEFESPDCGTPTPTFDGKFRASYNDSTTYSAACDGDTTLTTGNTKPSGYDYSAMTTAQIGQCVTSIGNSALSRCRSLTSVTIPDSVTSIGKWAFYLCDSLPSIDIPDSVTSIGSSAFYGCTSLTSCTIGSGVTSIGGDAFSNCRSLTSIDIPDNVTSIGMNAFQLCTGLTTCTIGNGVTGIGDNAFNWCSSLTSIDIPDSVTSIGNNAFGVCSGLTSIDIPDSVTSIGNDAFSNCYSLSSCTIGSGVTSIGNTAFMNCSGLASVTVNATTPPTLSNVNAFTNTPIASGTGYIYVPCNSVDTYKAATNWSTYADRIQGIPPCGEPTPTFDGKFRATYTGGTTYSAACDGNTTLTSGNTRQSGYDYYAMQTVEIGDCVTSIGGSAFYKCSKLTSITIPSGVTSIGSGSFQDCSKLTSITIPSGVTSLGDSAFRYCYSLTSITIPNTVSSIGNNAFNNCRSLTSCTIGSGVTSIGMYAFQACSGLTSIDIPNSVTRIGSYSFNRCTNLTSCTIGSGVTNILSGAFYLCNSLTNLIIYATTPPALVGSEVFYGTPIESGTGYIYVPCASVDTYKAATNWSTYADRIQGIPPCGTPTPTFDGKFKATYTGGTTYSAACDSSTELTSDDTEPSGYAHYSMVTAEIGDCITSIGEYAFAECDNLSNISIPDTVTSIGEHAFGACYSLESITIPSGITSIGKYAFEVCSALASVTVKAVTPPTIGSNVFSDTPIESGTGYIYVPAESVNTYKSTSGWSTYANYIQPIT